MADTSLPIQSQPQQFIEYIGGPMNGQRLPVLNSPVEPNPSTGKCYMIGTGIVVPCDWPGAQSNPLPFTTQQGNEPAMNPDPQARGSNPNSGTLSGPVSDAAKKISSVGDFLNWITNGDTMKGFGLILLAGLVGTLGILIFVFAPNPNTVAKSAIKAAV